MKKPTAMELWNFRIIMVPPMDSINSIRALHMEAKPSAIDRVPMTKMDISMRDPVRPRIEYLVVVVVVIVGGQTMRSSWFNAIIT